jgi:Uma2 family endonuclease
MPAGLAPFASGGALCVVAFERASCRAMMLPMNQMFPKLPPAQTVRTTQAAEGVPRWRWTTAELLRMCELGLFDEDARVELIGGEIVPMSPAGRRHEVVADELALMWQPILRADRAISQEKQFNLDDETYTKPEIMVRPRAIKAPDVRGDSALLIVEVADSSLSYDLAVKSATYARFGVREYWVVEAWTLKTHVHRQPTASGYDSVIEVAADIEHAPLLVPELKVTMAKLDI